MTDAVQGLATSAAGTDEPWSAGEGQARIVRLPASPPAQPSIGGPIGDPPAGASDSMILRVLRFAERTERTVACIGARDARVHPGERSFGSQARASYLSLVSGSSDGHLQAAPCPLSWLRPGQVRA